MGSQLLEVLIAFGVAAVVLYILFQQWVDGPSMKPPPDPEAEERRETAIEKCLSNHQRARDKIQQVKQEVERDPAAAARSLGHFMRKS